MRKSKLFARILQNCAASFVLISVRTIIHKELAKWWTFFHIRVNGQQAADRLAKMARFTMLQIRIGDVRKFVLECAVNQAVAGVDATSLKPSQTTHICTKSYNLR